MAIFSRDEGARISTQLARIERKLDAIVVHLKVQIPDDGMNDIRDLAAAGKKIAAIKAYRARTGAGLAEAKRIVENGIPK